MAQEVKGRMADGRQPKMEEKNDKKKERYVSRYKAIFAEKIVPKLMNELGYKNPHQVPKLEKIVVNIGVGQASRDEKILKSASNDLSAITGQKPKVCRARISVANFKIRAGMPIGVKVTLRGNRMWDFFDKLVNLAMPRIRDFRGANPDSFDGHGNYNLGLEEQVIFPEIEYDKVDAIRGMNVTIVTSAKNDEEAYNLLEALGFPFERKIK